MKKLKFLKFALCGGIVFSMAAGLFSYAAEELTLPMMYGDLTGDGKVDWIDLNRLQQYILKSTKISYTAEAIERADMNHDGSIDSFDVLELRRKIMYASELKVSKKVLKTTDEDTTVYFYADVLYPEKATVTLCNALTGEPIMEMVDDGKYSISGDDLMNDGVYSCKLDIDNSVEKTLYYYAKIEETGEITNYCEIKIYKPLSSEDLEDMAAVDNKISALLSSDEWSVMNIGERKQAAAELLAVLAEEGLIRADSVEYFDARLYFQYACGVGGDIMLRDFELVLNSTDMIN